MRRYVSLCLAAAAMSASAFASPLNVFGTWVTEAGSSHIQIADCGDGTPCGTVVWIDQASLRPGDLAATVTDAKGNRVLGLKMLYGFKQKSSDWRSGTIYDPEAGKTYGSRLKQRSDGTLEVKGCIGPICQTQVWSKAG